MKTSDKGLREDSVGGEGGAELDLNSLRLGRLGVWCTYCSSRKKIKEGWWF